MNQMFKRAACILLAVAAAASLAACNKKPATPEESASSESQRIKPSSWLNELLPPDLSNAYRPEFPVENKEKLADMVTKNADSTVWLKVPNTTIDDVVVQTTDNDYYYRRDEYKQYSFQGCLWLDYECDMKTGSKADVPQNTIIYGHNLGKPQGVKDDPNDVEFAQLLKFEDPEFAAANPYVYLTTEGEDLIYQVFGVFYSEANMKPVSYIYPSFTEANFTTLIEDMRARSVINYPEVTVESTDKILTLSTCCYKYGTYAQNKNQRFVVVAKLVKGTSFSETAVVEKNESPKEPSF